MRIMSVMFSVLAPLCLAACAGVQLPKEQLRTPGELLFNGYTKAEVDCWHCHNGDGKGSGRGPALPSRVRKRSVDQLRETILNGDGFMPKFRAKLTDDEVTQLVTWLQEAFPPAPTEGTSN